MNHNIFKTYYTFGSLVKSWTKVLVVPIRVSHWHGRMEGTECPVFIWCFFPVSTWAVDISGSWFNGLFLKTLRRFSWDWFLIPFWFFVFHFLCFKSVRIVSTFDEPDKSACETSREGTRFLFWKFIHGEHTVTFHFRMQCQGTLPVYLYLL